MGERVRLRHAASCRIEVNERELMEVGKGVALIFESDRETNVTSKRL